VLRQTEASIVIEVKDRGIGIDSDDLAHIFEPYLPRPVLRNADAGAGAGLGLTLVQQILASKAARSRWSRNRAPVRLPPSLSAAASQTRHTWRQIGAAEAVETLAA